MQKQFQHFISSLGPPQLLAQAVQPVVTELLEQRRLFSISVTLSGTVLVVAGDSGSNNLSVYQEHTISGDKLGVWDEVGQVRFENDNWTVGEEGNVTSIDFDGNAGLDTMIVEIDGLHLKGDTGVDVPADMYGGSGNDSMQGGDLADTIGGAEGLDIMEGRGGNDTMRGWEDADDIDGGAGVDVMYGGAGADTFRDSDGTSGDSMYGEAGNDTFHSGGIGNDLLDGGADTDDASDRSGGDTTLNCEIV